MAPNENPSMQWRKRVGNRCTVPSGAAIAGVLAIALSPASACTHYVRLSKLLNFSVPWLPHWQNVDYNSLYLNRLLWSFNELIYKNFRIVPNSWQIISYYYNNYCCHCLIISKQMQWPPFAITVVLRATWAMCYFVANSNSGTPRVLVFWGLWKIGVIIRLHFITPREGCFHLCAYPQRRCNHSTLKAN